ncbi:tetrahydromethanopterin S-methyltransferase, subunit A [Methanococcus vannielii SB]|jgi:tetrahydromethanopterin S-methyltransferase subunit A|uniref:Tetrahydromethanopterin S-methyltransferase subunit A n=1 Tax=Methanococcus vannielii (strain ATCC 35089 / DSM 1224 / JCM 13029 / OCM 148 / SB) TaxID=406327 RepID=A6UQL1_METVS|nr:tetrahydromethanopterin S-methyltransferase subunit A [Methanococcus vannielii]ABR54783.1 tetrahydromethanopterin S-methyltransferase, subunit A [Methanococcus vannielii SB]
MANKKAPAAGWPVANGEYVVGNPESCVAVVTLGSHGLDQAAIDAGAAISGPCHTENLGIEKVVANYISNPNIRFMIIAGSEVQGHITGQCLKALYENGIGDDGGIIGAKGAIPFMENVGKEPVGRFQKQIVECVNLIDVEDKGKITEAIKNCISKDPGALEEDAMVVELEGGKKVAGEEEGGLMIEGIPTIAEPDIESITNLNEKLEYKVGLMTRDIGLASGVQSETVTGLMYGALFAVALIGIPIALKFLMG